MNPYSYITTTETTMSTEAAPVSAPAPAQSEAEGTSKPAETTTTTTTTTSTSQPTSPASDKPLKKVASKKDIKNDPSRFDPPGINFNAKMIGIDDVPSARGDKMCQESMQKLKLAVRASKEHKQKIVINVSKDGIKIIDIRTLATNHTHPVHKISFISRDVTDSRAFGYVYGVGDGSHKFFAIKTEKAAEGLVLSLRDLFQVVYEIKKKEMDEAKKEQDEPEKAEEVKPEVKPEGEAVYQVPKNGAPVENGGENIYQVPSNNSPVKTEQAEPKSNLLDLEEELQTLGQGIEQMNTMESMFSEFEGPPPPTSQAVSSVWGDASSTQQQATSNGTSLISLGGLPFPTSTSFPSQPGGNPGIAAFPGQPFVPQPQMGFPQGPQSNFAAFGQPQPVMGNPFPGPSVPPRTVMAPGGFPATPFPGPAAAPTFPVSPGQPGMVSSAPVPLNDPFANDPFSSGPALFDDNVMTPDKISKAEETTQEVKKPKDAFDDLCAIGSTEKRHKSPKDMFTELSAPPKKSLNELKVETTTNQPKAPKSPQGFQANDPFGM